MSAPAIGAAVNVEANDWQEAVRAAAQLLVDVGAAEQRYVEGCVATVNEHGPYIVLAPGLALAHARPDAGAVSAGLGAATLQSPVAFGHPQNDPVDLVLSFCANDDGGHVTMLANVAKQLQSGLADALRAAETADSVRDLLAAAA